MEIITYFKFLSTFLNHELSIEQIIIIIIIKLKPKNHFCTVMSGFRIAACLFVLVYVFS